MKTRLCSKSSANIAILIFSVLIFKYVVDTSSNRVKDSHSTVPTTKETHATGVLKNLYTVNNPNGTHYTFDIKDPLYTYTELASTSEKSLVLTDLSESDASEIIYLLTKVSSNAIQLGIIDDFSKSFVSSPNKKHALLISEQNILLINLSTLEYKIIFTPLNNTVMGTYTDFPSFEPEVSWINDSRIKVNIYPVNTRSDVSPKVIPTEVKEITVPVRP